MAERPKELRCAIYTRKSSEEGLEQDFNSLHAQREACEAYIASQRHEGWRALPQPYNDGGFSGGSMDRPGIQQLMADVAARKVDVVVVYKVDRLTRSLMDFARIVEAFDKANVSFVSVTQAFNTTTSMGRLTLNVLLSFAQFEREVTGERIRDKIAASKRKGLWMGGFVPLGYDAQGRTLVINETEASTVRAIFSLYLELRSVDALAEELGRRQLRTKIRVGSEGKRGGLRFTRGHLYRILSNPIYAGQIRHKKQVHNGQHPAIIAQQTWERVQELIRANGHARRIGIRARHPSLLAGLLTDQLGQPLIATHATKNGRRYRYYARRQTRENVSNTLAEQPALRLPAAEIESVVERVLLAHLRDRHWVVCASRDESRAEHGGVGPLLARAQDLAARLASSDPTHKREALVALVEKATIGPSEIALDIRCAALSGIPEEVVIEIKTPLEVRRRGSELKLVFDGDEQGAGGEPDSTLLKALAQAHRWWADLVERRYATIRELARAYGTDERYVARVVSLRFLPTKLQIAILAGQQPADLSLLRLFRDYSAASH